MKKSLFILVFWSVVLVAQAQMPHDAIYMPKKTACVAITYSNSSWSQYWENTQKRENLNLGTVTMQSVMPMAAVGVTDKLNIIASLPYISTKTSAGNLKWQKGLQDFGLWAKYKLIDKNGFSFHAILGGSIPTTNYVPDFLPLSIGIRSKTVTGRVLASYYHKSGMYLTGHGSYIGRSKIKIDRDAYLYNSKMYYTNEVSIPNATDYAFRLGFLNRKLQTEVFVERFGCVGGDNIRRNDMPFPTNIMQLTSVGIYGKFQPKNVGVNTRVAYVTNGLNTGQSLTYSVGLLYQLNNLKF